MLKLGSLWIELWQSSDFVLWIITVGIVSSILICLLLHVRRYLERKLSAGQMDRVLKVLAVYLSVILPLLSMVALYKGVFAYIGPFDGNDGLDTVKDIRNWSISYITPYGNHWVFVLLLVVWQMGFLIGGLLNYRKDRKILKKLKACSRICEDKELLCLREQAEKELGLKKPVTIWVSDVIDSPFVAGCFRQEIFFPQMDLSKEEIYLMLCHELTHCKKKDAFYRSMIFWFVSLYWFTLSAGKFTRYYTDVNEMACDDFVLQGRTKQEYCLYAETLVKMQRRPLLQEAVSLTGHTQSQLERRLENMLNKKTGTSKRVMAALTIFLITACPLTTLAASSGVCKLQDVVADDFLSEKEEEAMEPVVPLEEITENAADFKMTSARTQVQPRGVTLVDEDISGSKSLGKVTVSANGKIKFSLEGESTSDSFRAGYVNNTGGRKYVSSTDGELTHTFTISKAGTYELFVEAVKPQTIHITGYVSVK